MAVTDTLHTPDQRHAGPEHVVLIGPRGQPRANGALDSVAPAVEMVLDRFLWSKAADLAGPQRALADLVAEVHGLVRAGGKRLRPAFTYWGHRATGADHDDAVHHPAAAMELLHTFALIHDDVMDRSRTRRGRASAHDTFADAHRRAGATGDSDWFGMSAAVLAGDLVFVWADEVLEAGSFEAPALHRARQVFSQLRSEVIAGQYLDLALAADRAPEEAAAHQVALLKSARYTVTRPLLLGASLAGGPVDPTLEEALMTYGDAIGEAFQMRDDVLGMFGDPEVTGKSRLDDLREGKRTLLVLRAMRLATPAGRSLLERSLGDAALDEPAAERCREAIASSGALASIEALIADQVDQALGAVTEVPPPAQAALVELASVATDRRS